MKDYRNYTYGICYWCASDKQDQWEDAGTKENWYTCRDCGRSYCLPLDPSNLRYVKEIDKMLTWMKVNDKELTASEALRVKTQLI